jgi:hypothetical protein
MFQDDTKECNVHDGHWYYILSPVSIRRRTLKEHVKVKVKLAMKTHEGVEVDLCPLLISVLD